MSGKYDEIINLPHHVSQKHPPMPMQGRAAQFGSFAALKGHKEAVSDTEISHMGACGNNGPMPDLPETRTTIPRRE